MLMKPLLGSAMSGAIGGVMASHHRGSAHLQARGLRSNRRTQEQQVVRGAVSNLTAIWETGLSDLQRDSWRTYAANVVSTNRIGEDRHTSGMMMFVRANVARLQIQAGRVDDAPGTFNRGELTPSILAAASSFNQGVIAFFPPALPPDPWRSELNSFLLMFVGVPQNPGILVYRRSYRLGGSIEGSPIVRPAAISVISPFRFAAGQRIFVRFEVTHASGQYTSPTFASIISG